MNTLDYIVKKFNPQFHKYQAEIPGSRSKELLETFKELGFTTGAEIGVEQGLYSEKICQMIPGIKLYCIDAWKNYPGYFERFSQKQLSQFYLETKKRLKPYNCKIIRGFSENVYKRIPDESLDFLYIDGNHDFFYITQDLHCWTPKVRPGGIVSGHDFVRKKHDRVNHVKDVIPAYTYAHGIHPWFVLREPGRRAVSSWFWVKKK